MSAEQERSSRYPALPREECRELLTSTTVGRIVFVGSRGLTVRPVNYRLDGERVLVRTSTDSVLAELADHDGEVVFEVDHHGAAVRRGWSVLARGRVASVAESEVDDDVLARLRPWADGDHGVLLGLGLDELTGRHVAFHD